MKVKSPLLRKIKNSRWSVYQKFKRLFSKNKKGKKILVNSFPKSGTHLLTQIVEAYPDVTNYYRFIVNATSFRFKERSECDLKRVLEATINREMLTGHLKFNENLKNIIINEGFLTLFIYRDPRDVIISEVIYLAKMNRWHKLSRIFKRMETLDEMIMVGIKGLPKHINDNYKNFQQRFSPYLGWISDEDTIAVKFEDLISSRREMVVKELATKLINHFNDEIEVQELIEKMINNIDPKKSHTYREGRIENWTQYFNEDHKSEMKLVAGDLLIQLGYEKDKNW